MVLYIEDWEVFLVKTNCSFSSYCVAVQRKYHWEFSVCAIPTSDAIYWVV